LAHLILDPVISVHPDQIAFEVFSKDEGCYAKLAFDHQAFNATEKTQYGTTNIDFSHALAMGIEQIRSHQKTTLQINQQAVQLSNDGDQHSILEKAIKVPHSWLRGFLQVQSSALLPADTLQIKAIDLYNILRHLRLNNDEKKQRRGLRIELTPGELPRFILEPWETLIETSATPYTGKHAKVIRLWGRRRLALLKRFLPYTDTIDIALLGNGLPSYWMLKGNLMSLTLAITGYTSSNWSQALNFDLLLPREMRPKEIETHQQLDSITKHLQGCFKDSLIGIMQATELTQKHCLSLLQHGCQQGLFMYDISAQCYRYRPISEHDLDMKSLQFRNISERQAYDLVNHQKALDTVNSHYVPGQGTEISVTMSVKADQRDYLSQLLITPEGHIGKAECSCHQILKYGLQKGPCCHLIALRIAYAKQCQHANKNEMTKQSCRYSRRKKAHEEIYLLTLNEKQLQLKWGFVNTKKERRQQLLFNSNAEAKMAYLTKIKQLTQTGFVDTTDE
jgi:predicted DNA-binding WGR domain protein